MRKLVLTFALASIASLALVACGGGSDNTTSPTTEAGGGGGATTTSGGGGGGGASSSVKLAASPTEIAYDTNSLTAKAGNITIDFNNPNAGLGHDVCVETTDGSQLGCSDVVQGKSTTLDLQNVKAGDYEFFCSVDSHKDLGMKGTLTVQ
jgi:plastocyanin